MTYIIDSTINNIEFIANPVTKRHIDFFVVDGDVHRLNKGSHLLQICIEYVEFIVFIYFSGVELEKFGELV